MKTLKWFIFYAQYNHEKKNHEEIINRGYASMLPLVKRLKQWSDRKRWVENPMFPCYNFALLEEYQIEQILSIPGIVKCVRFGSERAFLDQKSIDKIDKIIDHQDEIEIINSDRLVEGDLVQIESGSFKGMQGILTSVKASEKIVVLLDLLGVCVTVKFGSVVVKKISQ